MEENYCNTDFGTRDPIFEFWFTKLKAKASKYCNDVTITARWGVGPAPQLPEQEKFGPVRSVTSFLPH